MKWSQIFSLIFIVFLLFPNYLFFNSIDNPESKSNPKPTLTPQISEPVIESPSSNPETSFIQQSNHEESVPQPDPPNSMTGGGSDRLANLMWNETQFFTRLDNVTDIQIVMSKGLLYHETLNFTLIECYNLTMSIEEDYTWAQYPQLADMPFFMSFCVNGSTPVGLDGFWIYLLDGSMGNMGYAIFNATTPTDPGAKTKPHYNVSPIYYRNIPKLSEYEWVWFDIDESSIILDPTKTYQNTFYVAVWTTSNPEKLYWTGTDDGIIGDGVDEGDYYFDWTLDYYAEDYTLRVSIAPINKLPSPSEFSMMVNGTPVIDLGVPGTGWWENWPYPFPNDTGGIRYYNVSWLWPDFYQWPVTFDVIWFATYFDIGFVDSVFQVWVDQTTTIWTLNFTAEFPAASQDRLIAVSIEEDWNVQGVWHSYTFGQLGSPYSDWTEYEDYILIFKARVGFWTIECDAPDYLINAEVRNESDEIITEANSTDFVTVRGYVQDSGGINATNGGAYLLVYDPEDYLTYYDYSPLIPPPNGTVEIGWPILVGYWVPGVFTLNVLWTNGTEAGMNSTTFTVIGTTKLEITYEYPQPGEPIIRGDWVYIEAYYYDNVTWNPISNATVTIVNVTCGFEWGKNETGHGSPEYIVYNGADYGSPGWYWVYIFTDNASVDVLHNVTMFISEDFYQEQSYFKSFLVQTRETHLIFLQGYGLDNSSGVWRTTPEPYINDSSLQFTIRYEDASGFPLKGATIYPYLIFGSHIKRLDWIDLSVLDPTKIGMYNITIDTNPVEGFSFHEGNVGYIVIVASLMGYESTRSDLDGPGMIYVQPQPRPSFIDVPSGYQEIELFANWTYEYPLRVILRDLFTSEDLSHGEIVAEIPEIGNVTLDLATPGLGLYEITNLTTNLSPGTYNITLYATAKDFVSCNTTVKFIIKPKGTIQYETTIDYMPQPPNFGATLTFTVEFFFEEGLRGMGVFKNRGAPLPKGTEVTLEIETTVGDYDPETLFLDANGRFTFSILLDKDGGVYTFYISIDGAETYGGLVDAQLMVNGDPLSVEVRSIQYYIMAMLPFVVIVLIIFISSFLAYRQFRLVPKRRIRLQKLTAIADTFSDVANLHRLLVIHKESGICVFDPFEKETKDATLVAGFLQAISTFGHDLGETPGLTDEKDEEATTLRELTYEGFRILIHDGQFVRNALVLTGTPSKQLRFRLEHFTAKFEKRFRKDFAQWSGRVDQFTSASDLVEEIFLISLRLPHRVSPRRPRRVTLTNLESDLYTVAKEITKDREYIFLGQILSTYLAAAKRDKLEVLMAIYQLRQKGILKPWQLDTTVQAATPTPPSEPAADTELESDKEES